jgi:environmental stress-induced protein Ves
MMLAVLTSITPADYRRVRWKNGLGWTTELAIRPTIQGEFDWRVSIAEVDADCEFSCFPGIDRSLLVLAGEGMALTVGDSPAVELRAGGLPLAFSGDLPAHARLLGGPTRDFNVMTRRGRVDHGLTSCSIEAASDPLVLERPVGVGWLIYVERGSVEIGALLVAAGECALAELAETTEPPLELRGTAAVVIVRVQRSTR